MSVLTRDDILNHIREGKLGFSPNLDGFQMQPHAVDLRLGTEFMLPRHWQMTPKGREAMTVDPFAENGDYHERISLSPGQVFELLPGEMIIGETYERVELKCDNLMAMLFPRSSLNRRGLSVDLSGIVDVWYQGKLIIPISNKTDQVIRLYPGERICQLIFENLSSSVDPESAKRHGLANAKYNDNKNKEFKQDKKEEITLIQQGSLDELKDKYRLP